MLYLNLYLTVIKDADGYSFAELNLAEKENIRLQLNEKQEFVFQQLLEGKGIEKEFFQQIFGEDLFENWMKKHILIQNPIDQTSIYSRSKAFYWRNQCGNAQEVLKDKKVLILGCGGIGSHVGWNLTTLGVGEIDFVDFDVVELSNLNRQILYDEYDIGKKKVEVLKKKLQSVNYNIKIGAICKKVTSEDDLEELCTSKTYDLIIKSLDSPLVFSKWLDSVCVKNKLKYIAAIVMDSYLAVGPSYIPDKSLTYSEIMGSQKERERISGIAPSLGFMMYEISGKVSEEAFKILINKGKLRYTNAIEYTDCMNDTVFKLVGKGKKEANGNIVLINLIMILFFLYMGSCFQRLRIFANIVMLLYAVVVPVFVTNNKVKVHKLGCVNILSFQMFNIIYMIPELQALREWNFYEVLVLITTLFLAVSIMLIIVAMVQTMMWKLRQKCKKGMVAYD